MEEISITAEPAVTANPAPTSNQLGIVARIRSLTSSMSPAESRISQLVLHDAAAVSRMTISELSASARTSESTVVRTARALGYSGYSEMRLALAAAASAPSDDATLSGDIAREDDLDTVIAKLAGAEGSALRATADQLDRDTLAEVVEAIASARRVELYGVAISGLVASDLCQKLMRIGCNARVLLETHLALPSAALLGPDDVAIAVSHSGETADVLDPLRTAAERGATTVAITSQTRSPLARLARHALFSAALEEPLRPGAMASRTSQLLITDAIFVGVAKSDYARALLALEATTATLDSRRHRGRGR